MEVHKVRVYYVASGPSFAKCQTFNEKSALLYQVLGINKPNTIVRINFRLILINLKLLTKIMRSNINNEKDPNVTWHQSNIPAISPVSLPRTAESWLYFFKSLARANQKLLHISVVPFFTLHGSTLNSLKHKFKQFKAKVWTI